MKRARQSFRRAMGAIVAAFLCANAWAQQSPVPIGPTVSAAAPRVLAALTAPFTTTGTAANPVISASLATSVFGTAGNAIRVRVFGVNSADTNGKVVSVTWGASGSVTMSVPGSSGKWDVECLIQNVGTSGSPNQQAVCRGVVGGSNATTSQTTDTTDNPATGALTMTLNLTAATAGSMTANGAFIESVQ